MHDAAAEALTLWSDPLVLALAGVAERSGPLALEPVLAELDLLGKWALSAHPCPDGDGDGTVIEYICTVRVGSGLLGPMTGAPAPTPLLAAVRCLHTAAVTLDAEAGNGLDAIESFLSSR